MKTDCARSRRFPGRPIVVLAFVFGLVNPAISQQTRGFVPDPETFVYKDLTGELANKMEGEYVIATVGDVLMMEPASEIIDIEIRQVLMEADTTVGNLEINIVDRRNWTSGFSSNFAPTGVSEDIASMGFDLMTGANNHTMDMGEKGSRSSAHYMREQGIPLAGVGPTLSTSRMPVFQLTNKGRVALVGAFASTRVAETAARDKVGNMGVERWGVNPLQVTAWNVVTRPQLEFLREMRDEIVARRDELESAPIALPRNDPDRVWIFEDKYIVGPDIGEYHYDVNAADREANLLAVRNAKENADYAIFTMHVQTNRYAFQQVYVDHYPSQYVIDLAHDMIDNGADMYLGHGAHSMQGIEIYKGRPIFYNAGAFVLQEMTVDKADIPPHMTSNEADELYIDRLQQPHVLMSFIATSRYKDGKLYEVRIHPVDGGIGKNRPWSRMGIPQTPSPEMANEILARLQEYSKPFDTEIRITNGVGIIRVDADETVPVGADIRSTFSGSGAHN